MVVGETHHFRKPPYRIKFFQQSGRNHPMGSPPVDQPSVQVKSFDENQMVFTRACNAGKGDAWVPWIP